MRLQVFLNGLEKCSHAEGFAEPRVAYEFPAGRRLLFHGTACQREDNRPRDTPLGLPLANGPRRCVTVHHWHLDVHQHQVEMAGTKLFDGRLTVCRRLQLVRGMFQVGGDQSADVFRIVNQQDAATGGFR